MNLYTYVITFDSGAAPNYDLPSTTLAVCKPRIRKGAATGDVVLAFTGRRLGPEPHAVRWAGVVKEKLLFAKYWIDSRFQGKKPGRSATPDNFYAPEADGMGLKQISNCVHDHRDAAKDIRGEYVLVMDPVWIYGAAGPMLPTSFGYRMSRTARRNHRVHELTPGDWRQLQGWLDQQEQHHPVIPKSDQSSSSKCATSKVVARKKAARHC